MQSRKDKLIDALIAENLRLQEELGRAKNALAHDARQGLETRPIPAWTDDIEQR